ncbi:MAG: hypothetical protein NVS2B17_31230 [Candidatus Velthaea sp.]
MSVPCICIQPNICVDRGSQEVPDPSWLIGSATFVIDAISLGWDPPSADGACIGIPGDICISRIGAAEALGRAEGDADGDGCGFAIAFI